MVLLELKRQALKINVLKGKNLHFLSLSPVSSLLPHAVQNIFAAANDSGLSVN